jgi:hypothetical protein
MASFDGVIYLVLLLAGVTYGYWTLRQDAKKAKEWEEQWGPPYDLPE